MPTIKKSGENKRATTAIIGASGEHYVAAYLSGFKLIVAMPRAGIPGSDLFVSNEKGGHAIRVQVKTGTQATRKDKTVGEIYLWATSYAAIERNDKYLWYAYVYLNGWPNSEKLPEVFFVPSKIVVRWARRCVRAFSGHYAKNRPLRLTRSLHTTSACWPHPLRSARRLWPQR